MFSRKLSKTELYIIEKIIAFVKSKHHKEMGHDYSHVLEVCRWAVEIGSKIPEPVDPFIIVAGSLLHDIGRVGAPDGSFHGIDGGSRAREFLIALLEDPAITRTIVELVVRHTPTSMLTPKTIEEKVVYDADGIERLGLMGMVRGIMGKKGSMEFIIKDRIKKRLEDYDKFYFETSKALAEPYYRETLAIVKSLEAALDHRLQQMGEIESFRILKDEM